MPELLLAFLFVLAAVLATVLAAALVLKLTAIALSAFQDARYELKKAITGTPDSRQVRRLLRERRALKKRLAK